MRPLNSYSDLKGLKIRNSGGAGQAWRTQFMGAVPNTTPLPNVALALSQGTFDGLITTNETIASAQFWESGIRHAFEDDQFFGEYIPIVRLDFWRRLSPDLQQSFTDVWRENIENYRMSMAAAQSRARNAVRSHGIKIVVPSTAERSAKRGEMLAHQPQLAALSRISPEIVAAVTAELDAG
jgi:C4-dicarboxylate-binding protein DctP